MDKQSSSGMNQLPTYIVGGTHNSFSYLPVKQWWLRPFAFIAKCQDKPIYHQILECSALDIRVCFENNKIHFAHGAITYKGDVTEILKDSLIYFNRIRCGYVRIILEKYTDDNIDIQNILFRNFCQWLKVSFPNIKFYGGNYKKTWERIYDFKSNVNENIIQYISSMTDDARWYEKICPRLYAKRMNHINKKKVKDNCIHLFDFI